jgi:hypothetical protein
MKLNLLSFSRTFARADVVNKKAGLNSPFKRFAARDMRAVFGIDLIRANIISPEAESYLLDHEVDLDYANANAHMLPWSLYLTEPPVRHSLSSFSQLVLCSGSMFSVSFFVLSHCALICLYLFYSLIPFPIPSLLCLAL